MARRAVAPIFVPTEEDLARESRETLDDQVGKIEAAGATVAQAHLSEGRTIDEILDLSEEL